VYSFSIDGIRSEDKGIYVNDVARDILPPITSRTIDIPDRNGTYYYSSIYQARKIEVSISIISSTFNSNQSMVRTIAEFLDPASGEHQIIFDDESDKYYTGIISENTNVPQIIKLKQGTITFLLSYPYAKSTEDEVILAKKITTTFERASTAYDGTESVGNNVPRYTDGLYIEQGTTNLIGVSNFESGTDSWSQDAGVSIASTTEKAYIGNKSLKITFIPAGSAYRDYTTTFTAADKYTFSAMVYAPTFMVGKTIRFGVEQKGGVNPDSFVYTDFILISGWQFLYYTVTIDYSDRTSMRAKIYGHTGIGYGDVLFVDAPQFEKVAFFTTYTDGTRVYERAYLPIATSGINFNTGTIEFYLNKITTSPGYGGVLEVGQFSSPVTLDRFVLFNGQGLTSGEKQFLFAVYNGSTAEEKTVYSTALTNTPAPGQNYYVCIRWNLSSTLKIDVYDYTYEEHKTGASSITMTTPTFGSYTNIYLGLLTSFNFSNWRFRAIKFSSGMIADSDILTSIGNVPDEFTSDSRTTYLVNFINETLSNTSFTRVGTAPAAPQINVCFTGSVAEYKITQVSSAKYVRVIDTFIAGDILLIDCSNNKVYVNGVLSMDLLDINSQFFLLEKENIFNIDQYTSSETVITYTPTWL